MGDSESRGEECKQSDIKDNREGDERKVWRIERKESRGRRREQR